VLVLVDGSNVARCDAWRARVGGSKLDVIELRRRLVDAVGSWAAQTDHDCMVVFDGVGPWRPGQVRITDRVVVEGSGAATGDELVERHAARARTARRTHWVATDDRQLQVVAGAGADRVLQSASFVEELVARDPDEPIRTNTPEPGSGGSRMFDSASPDVLDALERLRRGLG